MSDFSFPHLAPVARRARRRRVGPVLRVIAVGVGLAMSVGLVVIGANGGLWPDFLARLVGRPDFSGHPILGLAEDDGVLIADLDGRAIQLDPAPDEVEPAPGAWDELRARAPRFSAPAQGLEVALLELGVRQGRINPPTLRDAFEVLPRDPELPRVIALHAVRKGRAAGNSFYDQHRSGPTIRVAPGDVLQLGAVTYVVDTVEVMDQLDAARSPAIWGRSPDQADRLVVITCLQRPDRTGPAQENLVIFAQRAPR